MATLNNAKEVLAIINEALNPVSVTVFGSIAREGVGNDLDLLILLDDRDMPSGNPDLLMQKCLKQFYKRFPIDPFVITQSAFRRHYETGSPFLSLILKEGRALYMKDAVKEWIKQAEDEFQMAQYLFDGDFYKGTCFHSQQAIEKALKALLLSKEWMLEKTHSIARLVSLLEDRGIIMHFSDEDVVFLDSIYRGRYPAEAGLLPLGEPAKEDAQRAVDLAAATITTIKSTNNKL